MSEPNAKVTVTITVDLLLPVPEEDLDSYLDYCEETVVDGLKRDLRRTLIAWIDERRR